jgi:DNA-binding XRE family transcriptional regulator
VAVYSATRRRTETGLHQFLAAEPSREVAFHMQSRRGIHPEKSHVRIPSVERLIQGIFAYADFACTVGWMRKSFFSKRYKIFQEELAKARDSAGLSQGQLAKRLGWDQTYVSKIERGVRRVDLVELIAICEVMSLDAAEFVKHLQKKYNR